MDVGRARLLRMRRPLLPGERRAGHGTAEVLAWPSRETWTESWYPQGIDAVLRSGMGRVIGVTWFQQKRIDGRMKHVASRVTFVLPRGRVRVAEFVLPDFSPAAIHAGGLAWLDDRLLVAASSHGIWEFRLSDAVRRGSRTLLPRHAVHEVDLKASFLGRLTGTQNLLVGNYATDAARGRLLELEISDTKLIPGTVHAPGIPRMQGAIAHDGRWYVSSSNAHGERGDLWSGIPGAFTRHAGYLPPGPEDIALDPSGTSIWTAAEHPYSRVLAAVPLPA